MTGASKKVVRSILVLGCLLVPMVAVTAGIDDVDKYARVLKNDTLINFNPGTGEVELTESGLLGYAWGGGNIGWINLQPAHGGVENDQGALSGYAWGENIGWVNFNPDQGGVTVDGETGRFDGYAWSERLGWIVFSCETDGSCADLDHRVVVILEEKEEEEKEEDDPSGRRPTPGPQPDPEEGEPDEPDEPDDLDDPDDPEDPEEEIKPKPDPEDDEELDPEDYPEPELEPDPEPELDPEPDPEDEPDPKEEIEIDEELPTIWTDQVTEKEDTKARFRGDLISLGQIEEVEALFRYRIKEEAWQETEVVVLTESSEFSRSVSDLTPGEEYEVKAVVRFDDREIIENIVTFIAGAPWEPSVEDKEPERKIGVGLFLDRLKVFGETTRDFFDSPVGKITGLFAASAGMAAGAGQILTFFPGITSLADLYLLLLRLIGSLLGWLGLRRQSKPWGTVYDSVTKRPLDPVYVTAHKDSPEGEEVGSAITDIDGRFGFFLPAGVYYLKAGKTHYRFPSTELAGRSSDELYSDLYFGEKIETSGEEVLNYNIPMDPVGFDWNEFAKNKQSLFKMHSDRETLKNRIFNTVFYLGFAFTGLLMIFSPSWLNGLILTVYVLILLWQWYFGVTQRPVQVIGPDGQPLPFAILRFHLADLDMEVKHVVSDALGRFYVLIRPGRYYVTVEEKLSDGSYRQIFRSGNWSLEKGVLEGDIVIDDPVFEEEPCKQILDQ